MQAIGAIKMDNDVLGWVIAAQKESHADSRNYRTDRMATLQAQYDKLQHRLDVLFRIAGNHLIF